MASPRPLSAPRRVAWLLAALIAPGTLPLHAGLAPGAPAPALSAVPTRDGQTLKLEDYRGRVVYLDFWASWCGPCRQSLPALDRLRLELHARGFEVIAVNLDEDSRSALDFLEKYPVRYLQLLDPRGTLARLYQVEAMPSSFLIDRRGVLRRVHQGFKPSDLPGLRQAVLQLLAEP